MFELLSHVFSRTHVRWLKLHFMVFLRKFFLTTLCVCVCMWETKIYKNPRWKLVKPYLKINICILLRDTSYTNKSITVINVTFWVSNTYFITYTCRDAYRKHTVNSIIIIEIIEWVKNVWAWACLKLQNQLFLFLWLILLCQNIQIA